MEIICVQLIRLTAPEGSKDLMWDLHEIGGWICSAMQVEDDMLFLLVFLLPWYQLLVEIVAGFRGMISTEDPRYELPVVFPQPVELKYDSFSSWVCHRGSSPRRNSIRSVWIINTV